MLCVYGLPASYWLIDGGEGKDSIFQQKKEKKLREKGKQRKKIESINRLCCPIVLDLLSNSLC